MGDHAGRKGRHHRGVPSGSVAGRYRIHDPAAPEVDETIAIDRWGGIDDASLEITPLDGRDEEGPEDYDLVNVDRGIDLVVPEPQCQGQTCRLHRELEGHVPFVFGGDRWRGGRDGYAIVIDLEVHRYG